MEVLKQKEKVAQNEKLVAAQELQKEKTGKASISRNEPCPCGSGKKFKRCCGQ
jgi:uncharacterized protein YecA (UPF0149 family)